MSDTICIRCVEKIRDTNCRVREYGMLDDNGRYYQFTPLEVKSLINGDKYDFINLRLDSIGRIINKPERYNKEKYDKGLKVSDEIFEAGFRACAEALKQGVCVEFTECLIEGERKYIYPEEFIEGISTEIDIERLKIDIPHTTMKFEQYLKKNNILPYKLDVLHKDCCLRVISYSSRKCTIFIDQLWYTLFGVDKKYYLLEDNYRIKGMNLGNKECKVHVITSRLQGFDGLHVISLDKYDKESEYSDLITMAAIHRGLDKCYNRMWGGEQIVFEQNLEESTINIYDNEILKEMQAVGYYIPVNSMILAEIFNNYLKEKGIDALRVDVKSKSGNIHCVIFSMDEILYKFEERYGTLLKQKEENLMIHNYEVEAVVIGDESNKVEVDKIVFDNIIKDGLQAVKAKMICGYGDEWADNNMIMVDSEEAIEQEENGIRVEDYSTNLGENKTEKKSNSLSNFFHDFHNLLSMYK